MSHSRDHFEKFEDHTLLKHAFLRGYLAKWAMILLSPRAQNSSVCFIDAFAGPGHDSHGTEGSPLIAMGAAKAISDLVSMGKLPLRARLRLAFVEVNAKHFQALQQSVGNLINSTDDVLMERADYADVVPRLVEFAAGYPTLTFVDPYGVSGLDAAALRTLLAAPKAEVFVLVSGIGAARLHGVLTADSGKWDVLIGDARAEQHLFAHMDEERIRQLKREKAEHEEGLDVTRPASKAALLRALGSDSALVELGHAEKKEKPTTFLRLFGETLVSAGATHLVAIPMRDSGGGYKYTLIHASKSARAVRGMKEAVSAGLNRDELSADMRGRIRQDLAMPVGSYLAQLEARFAGQSRHWSASAPGVARSLKETLLETTPLFDFQCPEVKRFLKERGYLTRRDGKEWVEFPTMPS